MRIATLLSGLAVLVVAAAACKGEGSDGGGGGYLGYGGSAGYGGYGEPSCEVDPWRMCPCECACEPGGAAALVCNDSMHPSFCAGVVPVVGGECETALTMECGFTAEDIADLGCSP